MAERCIVPFRLAGGYEFLPETEESFTYAGMVLYAS